MQRIVHFFVLMMLFTSTNTFAANKAIMMNTLEYRCENVEQPSSKPYLAYYSPHMLQYAVDIDFVVKQTGVCTSLLIALMEQQSGLIRRHSPLRKPWVKPFGDLSKKFGFVPQLVDVAKKLRELKNRSYSGYMPADEAMAYLFNVKLPVGTPKRLLQDGKRFDFQMLYRDMFMHEYTPTQYLHSSDFGLGQDLLLRSWQFRQDMVGSIFAAAR